MSANMTFNFTGQTAVITGAARGIGLEVARFFADAGADTFLIDVDGDDIAQAAQEVGGTGMTADVSRTDDVQAVVDQIVATTGRIDILVNNAGILRDNVLWKIDDEDWEAVLAVHLGGTFKFTRACVPHFRAQQYGRVVNVTSYTGLRGNPGQANYGSAKAGIIGFSKTAARELARFGVTVNVISPSASTRMVESIPEDKKEALRLSIPAQRFGAPAEMATAIGYLASKEAAYVTGVVHPVDGGASI